MEVIGIICEYNPFHHGHAYHIKKIKEAYPDSIIILILNGYFLERGEVSVLTKEDKTRIALNEGIDIVIEHPFVFGSNSADIFAETAVKMLHLMGACKIVFGSETNDVNLLTRIAKAQLEDNFNAKVKEEMDEGINYPTALNKALGISVNTPNDLLGISYIKAILKNKLSIEPVTIQRTNDYHDITSNEDIISASNIRAKYNNNLDVSKFTNYSSLIKKIDDNLLFNLISYKIISDKSLNQYLSVDEGIEYKLIKEIKRSINLTDLIMKVKSKRYTYNRIRRMLMHILIGLTKEDKKKLDICYLKLLGFNSAGKKYINTIKKDLAIPLTRKISDDYIAQKYELKASLIYDLLTQDNTFQYELANKPIYKEDNYD